MIDAYFKKIYLLSYIFKLHSLLYYKVHTRCLGNLVWMKWQYNIYIYIITWWLYAIALLFVFNILVIPFCLFALSDGGDNILLDGHKNFKWSMLLVFSHLFTYIPVYNIFKNEKNPYEINFITTGAGYMIHDKGVTTLNVVTHGTSYLKTLIWSLLLQTVADCLYSTMQFT